MAAIQKQIEQFDNAIRLKRFDENATLRQKRDAILDKIRDRFTKLRQQGRKAPTFEPFNQGSYQMGTGIQPAQGDYDIDVGLRFNCTKQDFPDPVDLKILVADALANHTELGTEIRRPCVTVYYKKDGEQAYHVDLAIYAVENSGWGTPELFLAKGKRNSDAAQRLWEPADPQGIMKKIEERFSNKAQQDQFLRAIRCFKRWKSERFKDAGNNAPHGIGLTLAAHEWFTPHITTDWYSNVTAVNDLDAMRAFANAMICNFIQTSSWFTTPATYRLKVNAPVQPRDDVFQRMTDGQMTTVRERLIQLRDGLDEAIRATDAAAACKIMRKYFGEEFPVS